MFSNYVRAQQKLWRIHLLTERDPATNMKLIAALQREVRNLEKNG